MYRAPEWVWYLTSTVAFLLGCVVIALALVVMCDGGCFATVMGCVVGALGLGVMVGAFFVPGEMRAERERMEQCEQAGDYWHDEGRGDGLCLADETVVP